MKLAGRVCLVTGATGGIGRAVALALAHEGCDVWAVGRDAERLRGVEADARSSAGKVTSLRADLDGEIVDAIAGRIRSESHALDVLVHCAGAIELGLPETVDANDFDRLYRVNLRAPFLLTRAFLPFLAAARGHVVFVNSSVDFRKSAGNTLYAATKNGLEALADGLRDEINGAVRVTSVYLGRTATPMQAAVHEHEGKVYVPESLIQPRDVADVVLAALTLGPRAEITDVYIRPNRKPRL